MGMRPAARMPKLTRRSRILIAVALAVVLLLLFGPRLVDAYVDWLWFGELGYRSVFTTEAGHPSRRLLGGGGGNGRHRVRRARPGVPLSAGVRPDQRPQRSGGPLPHRGDDPGCG